MIMIGGQVPADANAKAVHPGDLVAQTRTTMDFVQRVVEDLGATMDEVVKVNAFYRDVAGADFARLHTNLAIRSDCFSPAGTGVVRSAAQSPRTGTGRDRDRSLGDAGGLTGPDRSGAASRCRWFSPPALNAPARKILPASPCWS